MSLVCPNVLHSERVNKKFESVSAGRRSVWKRQRQTGKGKTFFLGSRQGRGREGVAESREKERVFNRWTATPPGGWYVGTQASLILVFVHNVASFVGKGTRVSILSLRFRFETTYSVCLTRF